MNNQNFWDFLKMLIIPAGTPYLLGEKRRLGFFMIRGSHMHIDRIQSELDFIIEI